MELEMFVPDIQADHQTEWTGMQSIAMLLGPPVAGYIVGNNPVTQLRNYKHAIILNGSLLILATGFAIAAKLLQNKDWKAKI
jgi:MFS family permease